jgi:prepilin-type N-terminal cleavage/methylation domain-containing protein
VNRRNSAPRARFRDKAIRRCGFTLVELVVVILLLGILTAVAAPKVSTGLRRAEIEAACLRVKADLNLARQTAMSRSTTQSVQFTVNSAVYTLPGISDPDHPSVTNYSVSLADKTYRSVITAATFGSGATLQFDRYGQAVNGGSLTVSGGGVSKTISVDAASGAISIL